MCLSKQVRSNARAGPSIVRIDIDGDHEAWKIHTVHAARVSFRDMSALFVCGIRGTNTTFTWLQDFPKWPQPIPSK